MNTKKKERNPDVLFSPKSLDEKSFKKLQLIRSNIIRDNLKKGKLVPSVKN